MAVPERLVGLIDRSLVVPFLGAGCSMEQPADLPSASDVSDILIQAGYGGPGDLLEDTSQRVVDEGGIQLFARLVNFAGWRGRQCTATHEILGELVKEGLIRWVLTTNWDVLIEFGFTKSEVNFVPVTRAESLSTESLANVAVVKLHGCINFPEQIKVTRQDMEDPEWHEQWAGVLFRLALQGNSMLFVGYSGSATAVSTTIRTLLDAGDRTGPDYVVDLRGLEELRQEPGSADFLDALQLPDDNFIQQPAGEFFATVRNLLLPRLLGRPRADSSAMLAEMAAPTQLSIEDLSQASEGIADIFVTAGAEKTQGWLREVFGLSGTNGRNWSYVPVIPNRAEIGRCWAWLATLLWAGALVLDTDLLSDIIHTNGNLRQIAFCVCPVDKRRDVTAAQVQLRFRAEFGGVRTTLVGVIFGGLGPMPADRRPYSMARDEPTPDVVRGGDIEIEWRDGQELFELLSPGIQDEGLLDALRAWADVAVGA